MKKVSGKMKAISGATMELSEKCHVGYSIGISTRGKQVILTAGSIDELDFLSRQLTKPDFKIDRSKIILTATFGINDNSAV